MKCPFCGKEMLRGILSGDGRCPVTWKQGDRKTGFVDRLLGVGTVTAAKTNLAAFTIEAWYCSGCHKMIFDTDVAK